MFRLMGITICVAVIAGTLCAGRLERKAIRAEARAAKYSAIAQGYYASAYGSAGGSVETFEASYGSDGGTVQTYSETRTYRAPVLVKVCRNGVCRYEYR